jgi:NAD(P)-dependent dehydrogenase (short-subunit alcohol dehydrogenase family)
MAQIFISYAREDFQHAKSLYEKLAREGFRPWMDKVDLVAGQQWQPAIERAIQNSDFFLLLLSSRSVRKRGFVQREIRAALDLWQDKLTEDVYLIPVMLESLPWAEVPAEISKFQWVEFYESAGWEDLVKALEYGVTQRGVKPIAEAKAAGEKVTPKQVDDKMMAVERMEAALRAVEAVEAAGGTAYYYSMDLRDGDKVAAVVDDIRQRHGKIDVLLHAGGMLIDKILPNKEPHQFALVFDIKADGFFSLLKAAKGMPIGATVSFSSVAGRFGNNGQSDYSSANDLLCKISSSMRTWRPETRGIAIDWTAWGQIGMASRGSVQAILESLGVDMLPPEAGVPTIRRELTYGATRGELVVAGRLGAWLEEKESTGGLDVDKVNAQLAERKNPLLMVGKVKSFKLYGGIEVETTLDPKVQPFLFDHAPDAGQPWLPGVMATEALAQLATVAAPGYRVAAVENEQMMGAFKFFRMEQRTLYLSATVKPAANGELIARCTLRSITKPVKEGLPTQVKEHFIANVRLTTAALEKPVVEFTPPTADSLPILASEIYKSFFHGPAYQVIERAQASGKQCVALMAHNLGPNTEPANAESIMAPRLVELCFQTAALWTEKVNGAMGLPLGFDAVTTYRQPEEAEGRRLFCICTTENNGETFDATVVDEAGNLFVELKSYLTVARPA